ncbi:hypothetical protein Calag_0643 [Caldisphaera lagunensis DSM 15908]|uniref:Uncharacterized protein n=1 Tax=Caldisphaera lagunensis (strain DSM 15908 / JCM 11604 / ANMR 0165 / IC-154) TaxID=1056495 RepID=L0A952_CALLD|nr:hypothetical protein [Caldisphaera lagunensis]AFZ70396.1 hypothetical protein Calag_0643 [Caldisphaera lagunensis DSM 15908]
MVENYIEELEDEKSRNLEEIIHHARWEAEMVRRLGVKWFEIRDKWLWESLEADLEFWRKNPRVRKALLETLKLNYEQF